MEAAETVEAEIAGQKFKASAQNLNHLLTLLIFVIVSLIAWTLWTHQQDTKDAWKEFVGAIKEQTNATKEQAAVTRERNCLDRFEAKERTERADFCRSIAR